MSNAYKNPTELGITREDCMTDHDELAPELRVLSCATSISFDQMQVDDAIIELGVQKGINDILERIKKSVGDVPFKDVTTGRDVRIACRNYINRLRS